MRLTEEYITVHHANMLCTAGDIQAWLPLLDEDILQGDMIVAELACFHQDTCIGRGATAQIECIKVAERTAFDVQAIAAGHRRIALAVAYTAIGDLIEEEGISALCIISNAICHHDTGAEDWK